MMIIINGTKQEERYTIKMIDGEPLIVYWSGSLWSFARDKKSPKLNPWHCFTQIHNLGSFFEANEPRDRGPRNSLAAVQN